MRTVTEYLHVFVMSFGGSNTWPHCQTHRGQFTTVLTQSSYCRCLVHSLFSPYGLEILLQISSLFPFHEIQPTHKRREENRHLIQSLPLTQFCIFFKLISSLVKCHYTVTQTRAESELRCVVAGGSATAVKSQNQWSISAGCGESQNLLFNLVFFFWNMWSLSEQ